MIIFLILGLLIAILAVIFALQNADMITIQFISWQFDGSLALIVLITFAIGVFTGLLFILPKVIRAQWALKKNQKEIKTLKDANERLEMEKGEQVEQQVTPEKQNEGDNGPDEFDDESIYWSPKS